MTLRALLCIVPLVTAAVVTGGVPRTVTRRQKEAMSIDALGAQQPLGAQDQNPTQTDTAFDEMPDLANWPRYPEGDPRGGEPIMPIISADVDEPHIVEAADWAVGHLRNMSDSGVYTSLSLVSVLEAATQEGVYHNNTMLTVRLASAHFLDGVPTSDHKLIVMADLEDGVRSFAIDVFPIMDPDAIEEFWMRKVDAHRARRDRELAALDSEFEEHYEDICEEEVARQGLRSELGAGADGQPQTDEAPPPVPEDPPAGDDMPPALDLGVERITIVGAPLPER